MRPKVNVGNRTDIKSARWQIKPSELARAGQYAMPIRKFEEATVFGTLTGRVAYVRKISFLPPCTVGRRWRLDSTFDAEKEIAKQNSFAGVRDLVQRVGLAIVGDEAPPTSGIVMARR